MNVSLALLLASLYLAQGVPSGFFAHALPALLRENGVSLELISLAKLLAMPWFFKFLWAPWVDRRPLLPACHYRGWVIVLQATGVACLLAFSLLAVPPVTQWVLLALLAVLVNTCMATQDIAADALAVRCLPVRWRGVGNAIQVAGYKLGMLAGGNGLLVVVAVTGWSSGFVGLAVLLALLMLPVLCFAEPARPPDTAASPAPRSLSLWQEWRALFGRPGMSLWLPVLLTYKLGDALGSGMIKPLLVDSGYTLAEIGQLGLVSSSAGMVAAFVGGLCLTRLGGWRALLLFGGLQAAGLAGWALVPGHGLATPWVYTIAIVEQVSDALSTVALFAAMMGFCRPGHEGGDYTTQMSLFLCGSGLLSLGGGWLASQWGYPPFFVGCGLLGIASLACVQRAIRGSA